MRYGLRRNVWFDVVDGLVCVVGLVGVLRCC